MPRKGSHAIRLVVRQPSPLRALAGRLYDRADDRFTRARAVAGDDSARAWALREGALALVDAARELESILDTIAEGE